MGGGLCECVFPGQLSGSNEKGWSTPVRARCDSYRWAAGEWRLTGTACLIARWMWKGSGTLNVTCQPLAASVPPNLTHHIFILVINIDLARIGLACC